MSAHTPGPWTVYSNSPDADGTEGLPSIMAPNPLGDGLFYVAQANLTADARLIAAAPDLLAALQSITGYIENGTLVRSIETDGHPDFTIRMMHFVCDLGAAQSAIARARETP